VSAAFADTYYWLALLNPDDPWHDKVLAFETPETLVMTEAIVLEVMDALSNPKTRPLAQRFWQAVTANPAVTVVPVDSALLHRGAAHYLARSDKGWSLTDCISFLAMEDRGITDALTGDRHFEQAGFKALLRR
jgi:predicted nucleic acid-binding protein